MSTFKNQLKQEIALLERKQRVCAEKLRKLPKGSLCVRHRKNRISFYHQISYQKNGTRRYIQRNITHDKACIEGLLERKIAEKTMRACTRNLRLLREAEVKYIPNDLQDIAAQLPYQYKKLLQNRQKKLLEAWINASYERSNAFPESLTQETAYGGFVRSKSEAIIANALYSFGIPFHYEEKLVLQNGNKYYYPDFTILLPDGSILIWEHFGLLSQHDYCIKCVEKLHFYQKNDFIIGKNLIITQDDQYGNCNSGLIYAIIKEQILPRFEGYKLQ